MTRLHLAIVAVLLALPACSTLSDAPADVRTYRMAYQPPEPVPGQPLPVVVRVIPFGIVSTYDRQSFIFRHGPYDIGIDFYNRWVANPAAMITDLIARDLSASRAVQAVLQTPSPLAADYELGGHIETIEERDQDDSCIAHLRLRTLLVRVPPRGQRLSIEQQSYSADEPCTRGDPSSFAEAMSRAVAGVSDQIRTAVVAAISRDLAERREERP